MERKYNNAIAKIENFKLRLENNPRKMHFVTIQEIKRRWNDTLVKTNISVLRPNLSSKTLEHL
jgi:hypothetical protein